MGGRHLLWPRLLLVSVPGQQAEDLGGQYRVPGAGPCVALQQPWRRADEEREEEPVGLGEIEGTLERAPGVLVAERVPGDRLQHVRLHPTVLPDNRSRTLQDRGDRGDRGARVVLG